MASVECQASEHGSLGSCLASWVKHTGDILIAVESYLDGSHIGKSWNEGQWVTLAAFAAEDSIWKDFDGAWTAILQDGSRRPRATYCHMTEAVHGDGEFTWKNGWNLTKVGFLVVDLLQYLQTLDKKRFHQFACTLDLTAHKKIVADGLRLESPISICDRYCAESVLYWYGNDYPGVVHSLNYFFDIDEPFKNPFEDKWKTERGRLVHESAKHDLWWLIKRVASTDMRIHPALQAADMLAWASNREVSPERERPFSHLSHIMKQIIPSTWIILDEARLRAEGI